MMAKRHIRPLIFFHYKSNVRYYILKKSGKKKSVILSNVSTFSMRRKEPRINYEVNYMKTKEELGKTILYYLLDNDMTVEAFSKKMNASKASVYNWIAGKPMSNRHYIKLQKELENYNPSNWIIEEDNL